MYTNPENIVVGFVAIMMELKNMKKSQKNVFFEDDDVSLRMKKCFFADVAFELVDFPFWRFSEGGSYLKILVQLLFTFHFPLPTGEVEREFHHSGSPSSQNCFLFPITTYLCGRCVTVDAW